MGFEPVVGKNMKFYRNSATRATPTYVLISEIGDLNVSDLTRGLAELKRRANGFVKNLPVFINSIAVEFRLIFGLDTTSYTILRSAFFSGACIDYAVMNDIIDEEGSEGLLLPAIVEQFPWNQNLEDVSAHDIRLATGYLVEVGQEIDPAWLAVPIVP
jgi:hypothetical protein